jgi:hypothetical protein
VIEIVIGDVTYRCETPDEAAAVGSRLALDVTPYTDQWRADVRRRLDALALGVAGLAAAASLTVDEVEAALAGGRIDLEIATPIEHALAQAEADACERAVADGPEVAVVRLGNGRTVEVERVDVPLDPLVDRVIRLFVE